MPLTPSALYLLVFRVQGRGKVGSEAWLCSTETKSSGPRPPLSLPCPQLPNGGLLEGMPASTSGVAFETHYDPSPSHSLVGDGCRNTGAPFLLEQQSQGNARALGRSRKLMLLDAPAAGCFVQDAPDLEDLLHVPGCDQALTRAPAQSVLKG